MTAPNPQRPFLGVSSPKSTFEKARFVVLPVPYERTASYLKGTLKGPGAFLKASEQIELWDEEVGREVWLDGICTFPPLKPSGGTGRFFSGLTRKVEGIARFGDKTLFVIGGEHNLTQATIPAYSKHYRKLSVLHFDAHADLREEYEGDPRSHACALHPASKSVPVVQVGIRNVAPEELPYVNRGLVKTFLMHENRDIRALVGNVLKALTKDVYISIDLDGFDPSVIPGVGTPQPGGFSWYDGLEIFRNVIFEKNVVGIDIMELCPLKGNPLSELAAAKLAYRLMGYISRRER